MNNNRNIRRYAVAPRAAAPARVFLLPRRAAGAAKVSTFRRLVRREGLAMSWTVDRQTGQMVCRWLANAEDVPEPQHRHAIPAGVMLLSRALRVAA